ncbi:MAG: SBBP repeat-containing protein [Candidatus Aminicenantes bacterium]|jgi:hypothetical protein
MFKKIGKNTYGFEVGEYDKSRQLVIDPVVLAYSTYLGGGGEDYGTGIDVDNSGNVYVTGYTSSTDFPTLAQYQTDQGGSDVFVTKLDTTQSGASSLIYSTYLGGNGGDYAVGIAVDSSGNAYVTGYTESTGFPTRNQYQSEQNHFDAFVTKLDTTQSGASSFIYSTYLGGGDIEVGRGIAVDSSGNAYVTGYTHSTDFPTLNQFQGAHQGGWVDAFVTKIDTTQSGTSSLIYSTYLGGGDNDSGYGIAVDNSGYVYVAGATFSTDFPTLNQYQTDQGLGDTFVTKIDTTQSGASSLIYSTYLGGEDEEGCFGIAVDNSGNVYVTGMTWSMNFPTKNQYQTNQGSRDAFVTKIDTTRSGVSGLIYSTYLGGGSPETGTGIAVDSSGCAYVTGYTWSSNFPTLNQFQTDQGDTDAFITKIDTTSSGASSLIYSTYLGGSNAEYINAFGTHIKIVVDSSENVYVTGETTSTDFPTLNQYQTDPGDNSYDTFVTKLIYTDTISPPCVTTTPVSSIAATSASSGGNVISDGGSAVTARGVCWSTSANPTTANSHTTDGTGTGTFTSSITGLTPGTTYHVRAYATNSVGTSYGNDVTFTTIVVAPTVTTTAVSNITSTTASSGGNVTDAGGAAVTARGVCWSTSANPTISNSHTTDGSGIGTFTSSITGLTPGTIYHVRAYATNSVGTSYGNDVTFTTNAVAPTVTTTAVSNITSTTASGGGNVTGAGGTIVTARGVCWSTSVNPTTSNSHTTDGAGTGVFTSSIIGLTPGTTYHVRAYATNSVGTSYGNDVTFTTNAVAPTVTTTAVSNITSTTASSGGNVTDAGGAAVAARGVCWSTSANPTITDPHTTDGTGTGTFTSSISGLSPGTTYHVRAYATNSVGTSYGNDVTFITNTVAPTVTTTAVSDITDTTAASGGNVTDAGGAAVTARGVCWSTSANPNTADSHTTDGTGTGTFTSSLTGLTPGTTYHVRAYATNSVSTSYGNDVTFITNTVAPTVTTTAVSDITATTAASGGNVTDAGGTAVTARGVCWSTSANPTTANSHTTDGTGIGSFASSLTGLTPGTTYHVRAYSTNSVGTSYGNDVTFITNTVAPTVTTTAVSNITPTTAASGGNVTSDGGAAVTARGICWSTSINPTTSDSHTTDGTGTGTFTSAITGLAPGTTYHVRAYATNSVGTSYGSDVNFTTNAEAPTVTTTAVSNITLTTATSGGNVTDNGGAAVTARGVCWSTSANPTSSDNHTIDGSGTGTFTSAITGLTPDTTYYLRAYATNTAGTGYGNQVTFTTAVNPTISGIVTNGTNPIEGVTITFSHDGHTQTTNADGYYSYTVTNGTSTTVTASKPGYTFTPSQYSYTDLTENKPNQDFTVLNSVSVIITNLQNGDTVSGVVIINAEVSSQDASAAYASIQAVTKVEFYIDGVLVKQDTSAPYQHRWETTLVSNGNHTIEAMAYHSSGITGQHVIMVNVSNSTESPHITLNRTSLNFGAVIGEPSSGSQTFLIANSGGGTLNWTASASETWIQATPLNGTANTQVTVSMDITGLAVGDYAGTVAITDANADNSPAAVNIFLTVNNEGEDLPLIGSIDSPIDGSTVSGSIPVTGWALDDTEITSVKIYRHPIWGQELGFVYIGEAVFVEGARPDIEIQYPQYPKNYEAGWGYMLLTNFLPNEGSGTFVITAIATDSSSSEVVLGSKTIICDNENSTKPFGTIDTPDQGGDAFGADFVNFGWALTPLPNTIPTDGSTIKVWLDGAPLIGNPVYNQYREDIAAAFPGYNNSDGAVGYYYLDTTLYADGIHTISWSVKDDAGNTSGIGSRYFSILNLENPSAGSAAALGYASNMTIQNLPVSSTPIHLKKGYETDSEPYVLYPDNEGNITIDIKEDERVEIQLGDKNEVAGSMEQETGRTDSWTGFLLIGHKQQSLPIGSTLDVSNGIFNWQPGPGFIGEYRFVFIEKGPDGELTKKNIKLVINPKF